MRMRIVNATPPADAEEKAEILAQFLQGVCRDEHPAVAGLALALVVASHLAGHRIEPTARTALLDEHVRAVRDLIPVFDAQAAAFEAQQAGKPS